MHSKSLIHRDVNPNNILYHLSSGEVRLIDLDLAVSTNISKSLFCNEDLIEGTLAFISPEQTGRMNRSVDYSTDIYSLGCTLYLLLTSKTPFEEYENNRMEIIHSHIARNPLPPITVDNSRIPAVLSQIVMKCMAKNPEARYQSCLAIMKDLDRVLDIHSSRNQHTDKLLMDSFPTFTIAENDLSSKFTVCERLIGREREIQQLAQAFEAVQLTGCPGIAYVRGISGIGKSALVTEMRLHISHTLARFCSGKFDQFNNIPYLGLLQAISAALNRIMIESSKQMDEWKDLILSTVGSGIQTLTTKLPELEMIVGTQPELVDVSPSSASHMFVAATQKLIGLLASKEHPLIIFLDDIQWMDSPTQKLIENMLKARYLKYVFLIAAYRDNIVIKGHPMYEFMETMEDEESLVTISIELRPLEKSDVFRLVAETVKRDDAEVDAVASIIFNKTMGNPFFSHQLLQTLYDQKHISLNEKYFSRDQSSYCDSPDMWLLDLKAIEAIDVSPNVVDHMTQKIVQLPENIQKSLQYAACIGAVFHLKTLATALKLSLKECALTLLPAVKEGLLLARTYWAAHIDASTLDNNIETIVDTDQTAYKFLHDKVTQAAYEMISHDLLPHVRFTIGMSMKDSMEKTPDLFDAHLVEIVDLVNSGKDLMTLPADKRELVRINLLGGEKAISSCAFEKALLFLQTGITILRTLFQTDDDMWEKEYFTINLLYLNAARAAYSSGAYDKVSEFVAACESHLKGIEDIFNILEIDLAAEMAVKPGFRFVKVIERMNEFSNLKSKLAVHPSLFKLIPGYIKFKVRMANEKGWRQFLEWPELVDPHQKTMMRMFSAISSATYYAKRDLLPQLGFECIEVIFKWKARSSLTAELLAMVAAIASLMQDFHTGTKLCRMTEKAIQHFKSSKSYARTLHYGYCFVFHWTEDIHPAPAICKLASKEAMSHGDKEYIAYAIYHYAMYILIAGQTVKSLEKESESLNSLLELWQCDIQKVLLKTILQFVQCVTGNQANRSFLLQGTYITRTIEQEELTTQKAIWSPFWIYQAFAFGLRGNWQLCVDQCDSFLQQLGRLDKSGGYITFAAWYYRTLAAFQVLKCNPVLDLKQKKRLIKLAIRGLRQMKAYAKLAPLDKTNKYLIILAEYYFFTRNLRRASECFRQSIDAAMARGNNWEIALACEMQGSCLKAIRSPSSAICFRMAVVYYQKWGGNFLAERIIESEHFQKELFLTEVPTMPRNDNDAHSPLVWANKEQTHTTTTTTITTTIAALDLEWLLKSSQIISQEMENKNLIKNILKILAEVAGAQKTLFIDLSNTERGMERSRIIVSEYALNGDTVEYLQYFESEAEHSKKYPRTLVSYVWRSQQVIIQKDAGKSEFATDSYFVAFAPKSVLCLPITKNKKRLGVIYLENRDTAGVFTNQRVKLINSIFSQVVISLENSRLYESVTSLNTSLERFVPHHLIRLIGKEGIVDVNPGDASAKHLSVVFSDIRKFTTISEDMNALDTFQFLNVLLSEMEPIFTKHNGIIDKFIGDAIMALFYSTDSRDSAENAVACVVALSRRVAEIGSAKYSENQAIEKHLKTVRIGFGINTGQVILGMLGSPKRLNATVIGDTVNLSSRLEGLTKFYQTNMIIGEDTFKLLDNPAAYYIREIDVIRVKGRLQPCRIYEVLNAFWPETESLQKIKKGCMNEFAAGLSEYRQRNFQTAKSIFLRIQAKWEAESLEADSIVLLYLDRCAHFILDSPPIGWDGVMQMESK